MKLDLKAGVNCCNITMNENFYNFNIKSLLLHLEQKTKMNIAQASYSIFIYQIKNSIVQKRITVRNSITRRFCMFQYFVFDFHMPPMMLFDKIITLSVSIRRPFIFLSIRVTQYQTENIYE